MGDANGHVALHEFGLVHLDELDVLPGVGLVGSNGAKGHGLMPLELASDGAKSIGGIPGRSNAFWGRIV
jgi:hypothetical protein